MSSLLYDQPVALLRQAFRTAVTTDFSLFEHLRPIRSALVVFLVLCLTYTRADVRALLPIGIGLLFVAIADRGVSLRRRLTSMSAAAIAITLGTFIGCLVSDNQVLHITIGGLAGLACGLAGLVGVPSMTAGVLGLVVFTIFSGSPIDLLNSKENTLLIVLGACLMIVSVLVEFVVRAALRALPSVSDEMPVESVWQRTKFHLHWADPFILHSIRLGIVIMVATALEEVLSFPHSYWIPMTVAWISRPDRDGTVEKVTLRVAGTLLGVVVAGLLIGLTSATSAESLVMIALAAYVVIAFLAPNYAVAVTGITVFVFFLFHVVGYPMDGSIKARVASTLIGAALVLVAVRIGPRPRIETTLPAS